MHIKIRFNACHLKTYEWISQVTPVDVDYNAFDLNGEKLTVYQHQHAC
jgi:hypothetical protein